MREEIRQGREREPLWRRDVVVPERKVLEGDDEADVAVIGAGMAGILAAYFLRERGKEVIVLEADRIAGGQTGRTTAKITSQHGLLYADLKKKGGAERAKMYAEANESAIRLYEQLIKKHGIDCGFERRPSYVYSRVDRRMIEREAEAVAPLGIRAHLAEETELPFPVEGALCFENQAQFHPLAFVRGISKDLTVFEQTRALCVRGNRVVTARGTVRAEHIVFATHYPFVDAPGFYFLRQHQERSYVAAVSGADAIQGMYYSADPAGLSFRSAGDCLLLGGGSHRTGKNVCGGKVESLVAKAESLYPNCRVEATWSAQDCVTHDRIPFIGKYSALRPNWYVATGFKKWGMTSSMVAAQIIADQVCGVPNDYGALFSPQRCMVRAAAADFAKDAASSVKGLTLGLFRPKKRCAHLGCECRWNPDERSWDCPCHGSRYRENGDLLDGPAQKAMRCAEGRK